MPKRVKVSYTLSKGIVDELDFMSKELNEKKSHLVEKALDLYFSVVGENMACEDAKKVAEGKEKLIPMEDVVMTNFQQISKLIYEATRLEAEWSERRIVPEPWDERDEKFRNQFVEVIKKYFQQEKLPTPEEAHNSWWEAYKKMGWKYGEKRDPEKKTHPDMVPYDELPQDEKEKDAIFLAFVWLAKELVKEGK